MHAGRRKSRGARRRELPANPELGGCDAVLGRSGGRAARAAALGRARTVAGVSMLALGCVAISAVADTRREKGGQMLTRQVLLFAWSLDASLRPRAVPPVFYTHW